jgi:hypothetical protein
MENYTHQLETTQYPNHPKIFQASEEKFLGLTMMGQFQKTIPLKTPQFIHMDTEMLLAWHGILVPRHYMPVRPEG